MHTLQRGLVRVIYIYIYILYIYHPTITTTTTTSTIITTTTTTTTNHYYYYYYHTLTTTTTTTTTTTGTGWLETILENIETGNADAREIPMLEEISRSIEGHTICALGDAAAWPVQG